MNFFSKQTLVNLKPDFVHGLCAGILLICSFLTLFKGIHFTFYNLQIRVYHVIYICLIYLLAYWKFEKLEDTNRFILAFVFTLMVYMIHDTFSTFVPINQGVIRFFEVEREAPLNIIISIWIRNLSIVGISAYILRNHLKFNWKTLALFTLQVIIWTWMAFQYYDASWADPINMTLDILPYYFLLG